MTKKFFSFLNFLHIPELFQLSCSILHLNLYGVFINIEFWHKAKLKVNIIIIYNTARNCIFKK